MGIARDRKGTFEARRRFVCVASWTVRVFLQVGRAQRRRLMSLVSLLIVLIVVGVLLWLVNNYIPMDRTIRNILNIVVVIGVVLWLLQVFGLLSSVNNIHIGR